MGHRGANRKRYAVAALVVWASASCGSGGDDNGNAAGGAGTTTTTPAGSAGGPAETGGPGATGAPQGGASTPTSAVPPGSGGSGPSSGGGGGQSTPAAPTIAAGVEKPCVHPGEEQTLTVSGVKPEGYVIYDTVYADGKSGLTTTYGSGHGSGQADGRGTFRATWRLAPTVPTGRTKVNVGATTENGTVTTTAEFVIVAAQQPCP